MFKRASNTTAAVSDSMIGRELLNHEEDGGLRKKKQEGFSFALIILMILIMIGGLSAKEEEILRKEYGVIGAPHSGHFSLEMNFKLDVEFAPNSNLTGLYVVYQAAVMSFSTPSTVLRNPLSDYGFYTLDFTQVSRVTAGQDDRAIIHFATNPPQLMNLNPYSFRLFILDEVTKKFNFPEGLTDTDSIQPLNFTLRHVAGKSFTIGLFAYDHVQIVETNDAVPLYYKRSVQFNWPLCGIENVRITFPNAIQTIPASAPLLSFGFSTAQDWRDETSPFIALSQNIFTLSGNPVETVGAFLSFKRDFTFESVCTHGGEQIFIDEESLHCGFSLLSSPDNVTIPEKPISPNGQIICPLPQNETVFSIFLIAKRQVNHPENSIIDNPIEELTQNSTNRFVLPKGAKIVCVIELPPSAKIILSIRSAFDPDVYIGMNNIPTSSRFDFFMDGTSTKSIVNPLEAGMKVYILIDASFSKGTGVVLITPTIADYIIPKVSVAVGRFNYWILVGSTVGALTVGLCILGILIALYLVISRKKEVYRSVGESNEGSQIHELLDEKEEDI